MRRSLLVSTLLLLFCCFTALAQDKKVVSGTVKDDKGTALPGVTILEKGTNNGATTSPDGSFKISVSPNATIVISSMGFDSQEIPVAGQTTINPTLTSGSKGLNEVVVTAMGIKRETRALGYAVSSVSSKDLTASGSTNFASALYGKAAGVKVVTPPGGATSAVAIQVRGVSSVSGNTQPLYVVDGVPIRTFNSLTNPSFGQAGGRIEGNGVLDLNPEDIESLSVLKGASASALYGSEATNGVVVITTKKGANQQGLGVELNYGYQRESLALSPEYQNEYGPGYGAWASSPTRGDVEGWLYDADGVQHPYYGRYGNFGPKFDGRQVRYWDGTMRKYEAQKDNYKDFYQNGYNSNLNLAISNSSEKGSFRVSMNRVDYKAILRGSDQNKNNFNFNGTLKLSKKVSVDLVSTYNYTFTHNRPYNMEGILGSWNGMFNRFDDMNAFLNKYQTRDGYKYVPFNDFSRNQDEKLLYETYTTPLMDYFWRALRNSYDEKQHRFINSATLNVQILDNLKFRGRAGGDFTGWNATDMGHNEKPTSLGYTGYYTLETRQNNSFYGDALLTYNPKISKDFDLGITGGVTGRKQGYATTFSGTRDGLVNRDWFSLQNSASVMTPTSSRAFQTDVAAFGLVNIAYKSWLYAEATVRHEGTSTLPPATNKYTYPSFNAGFVYSDVVKLPSFWSYGKLRGSYGIVGNHPNIYQANVAYNQYGLAYNNANFLYQQANGNSFGNNNLKSEKKTEFEVGLENRFLGNKITLDVSYYNSTISNMIMYASTELSTGTSSALINAGSMQNYGVEAAIGATPVATKNLTWNTRLNFAINRNKLKSLGAGLSNLTTNIESAGWVISRSEIGDPLGNLYVHPMMKDENGNKIVDASTGLYTADPDKYEYVGNIMPKIVGGWSNTVTYKNFALDMTFDYRFGGKLVSIPSHYQMSAGLLKASMKYRDAANGGISYNVIDNASMNYVADANGTNHDGVILPGVNADGKTNEKIISASYYYLNTYSWREGDYSDVALKNSYIKVREITLSYNLPKTVAQKLHLQNLQVALVGRNLFYIYKSLPYGLDPEVAVGSGYLNQAIDTGNPGPTRSLGATLRARF